MLPNPNKKTIKPEEINFTSTSNDISSVICLHRMQFVLPKKLILLSIFMWAKQFGGPKYFGSIPNPTTFFLGVPKCLSLTVLCPSTTKMDWSGTVLFHRLSH